MFYQINTQNPFICLTLCGMDFWIRAIAKTGSILS